MRKNMKARQTASKSPLFIIAALSIGSLAIALGIAMKAENAVLGAQAAGTFLRDASVFAAAILSGFAALAKERK